MHSIFIVVFSQIELKMYCTLHIYKQINLAAGFVYSKKDKGGTRVFLIPDGMDNVPLTPTCYPQGRGKDQLFGSPFMVCLGFPLNSSKMSYHGKVEQQKLFLTKVFEAEEVSFQDVFGSCDYLVTMLNGGIRASKLAYSTAHLKMMKMQNKNLQVLQTKNYTFYLNIRT